MINLIKILKDCPIGTKLYTLIHGEVTFSHIDTTLDYPIRVVTCNDTEISFSSNGHYLNNLEGECVLFPSKDNRDWSTFKIPVEKFDVNTLKPFDKVLVRDKEYYDWNCGLFSHYAEDSDYPFTCVGSLNSIYMQCIPYNDETKHLLGTTDTPPEKYINW